MLHPPPIHQSPSQEYFNIQVASYHSSYEHLGSQIYDATKPKRLVMIPKHVDKK